MQEKVSISDIDRSYRLGKKHNGSTPQTIIIIFARYNVRNAIFRKKKYLER